MTKRKKSKRIPTQKTPADTIATKPSFSTDAGIAFETKFWSKNWLPAIFLFIIAIGLYLSSIKYEFVLDDKIVYSENTFVQKGFAGIKEIFTTESFTGYFQEQRDLIEGGRYRPLSLASFAVEFAFTKQPAVDEDGNATFADNPMIGHLGNILLYALTALLLFRVLSLLFPMTSEKPWFLIWLSRTEITPNAVQVPTVPWLRAGWKFFESEK